MFIWTNNKYTPISKTASTHTHSQIWTHPLTKCTKFAKVLAWATTSRKRKQVKQTDFGVVVCRVSPQFESGFFKLMAQVHQHKRSIIRRAFKRNEVDMVHRHSVILSQSIRVLKCSQSRVECWGFSHTPVHFIYLFIVMGHDWVRTIVIIITKTHIAHLCLRGAVSPADGLGHLSRLGGCGYLCKQKC